MVGAFSDKLEWNGLNFVTAFELFYGTVKGVIDEAVVDVGDVFASPVVFLDLLAVDDFLAIRRPAGSGRYIRAFPPFDAHYKTGLDKSIGLCHIGGMNTQTVPALTFGKIWPGSRLVARKARNEYRCDTPDCTVMICKGDTYYAELRGGISDIRRCANCFTNREI